MEHARILAGLETEAQQAGALLEQKRQRLQEVERDHATLRGRVSHVAKASAAWEQQFKAKEEAEAVALQRENLRRA